MKKLLLTSLFVLLAASCNQNQTTAIIPTPSPTSVATPTPSPSATPTPESTPTTDSSKVVYLEWTFKKLPDGAYETPYDQIGLKLSGAVNKTVDLGKLSGCRTTQSFYAPSDEIPDDQVSYLFCWWAGAGDLLTVRWLKEDELTIYREEMGEDPEGTNYEPYVLKTITIPRGLYIEEKEME